MGKSSQSLYYLIQFVDHASTVLFIHHKTFEYISDKKIHGCIPLYLLPDCKKSCIFTHYKLFSFNRYVDLLLGEFKHYKTRLAHGEIRQEVMGGLTVFISARLKSKWKV